MQKRTLCAALCLVFCIALSGKAAAADTAALSVAVNGAVLETEIPGEIYNQVTYVYYWPIIQQLDPEATVTWGETGAVIQAEGLTLNVRPGSDYLVANGRYLYLANGVRMNEDGVCMVPATALAWAFGGCAWWDGQAGVLHISASGSPVESGETYYDANDLYWLSRIIYAESGNQPLEGKIAVGNVILNRVEDPAFPNSIYDVIFQRNQFTPAMTGSINRDPSTECVIAAKLCLEGANTVGDALYFVNPYVSPNSWASRNRPYVATIGAHAFFA